MRPRDYAENLEKSVGIHKAFDIAKEAKDRTSPSNWSNLPVGPIFHDKLENNQWRLKERPLRKLSAFWENVFGLLKKRAIEKGIKV